MIIARRPEQRPRRVCADVRGGDGHERRGAGRQEVVVDALSLRDRQLRGDVILKIARSQDRDGSARLQHEALEVGEIGAQAILAALAERCRS
jgi:hypothetical protein